MRAGNSYPREKISALNPQRVWRVLHHFCRAHSRELAQAQTRFDRVRRCAPDAKVLAARFSIARLRHPRAASGLPTFLAPADSPIRATRRRVATAMPARMAVRNSLGLRPVDMPLQSSDFQR